MMSLDDFKHWLEYFEQQAAGEADGGPPERKIGKEVWALVQDSLDRAAKSLGTSAEEAARARRAAAARKERDAEDIYRISVDTIRDLQYETESLESRARLLGRRAARAPVVALSPLEEEELKGLVEASKQAKEQRRTAGYVADAAQAIAAALTDDVSKARLDSMLRLMKDKEKAVLDQVPVPYRHAVTQAFAQLADEMREKSSTRPRTPAQPKTAADKAIDGIDSALGSLETARKHLGDSATLSGAAQGFYEELDLLSERLLDRRRKMREALDA